MKKNPVVLGIALVLFAGWLTWLGIQALGAKKPVIVSRAQLATSQYDVEVDLPAEPLPHKVTIRNVHWAADDKAPSGEITVRNLASTTGYAGPGTYLLPLVRTGNDFAVAGYPPDPGLVTLQPEAKPRIYPVSPEILQQWDEVRAKP